MEIHDKQRIIKYSILAGSFLIFILLIFGLTFLQDYIKNDSYIDALEKFFAKNDNIPSQYKNIKIKSLANIGNALPNSYKKKLASISVESFFVQHSNGSFLVFMQSFFTNAGLATGVFASESLDADIEFLGLLENGDYKVTDVKISYAKKKLKSLLEAAK